MVRGAVERRLPAGEGMVPPQERCRAAFALRLVIVAGLAVTLVAAAGSGRAGTAVSLAASSGAGGSGAAIVSVNAIAAGLGSSCAVTSTGGVKCWGTNGHDELGNAEAGDS